MKWSRTLNWVVRPDGVDYDRLAMREASLDEFVSWVAEHGPNTDDLNEGAEDRRLSILLNAYNAHVLRAILFNWPLDSVQEVGGGLYALFPGSGFFHGQLFRTDGEYQTLYMLATQDIVARYQEPLLHIALTQGAKSSPPLKFWSQRKLQKQLTTQLTAWLATDDAMRLSGDRLQLHDVFVRHADDFVDWSEASTVCAYLAPYANGERQEWLMERAETCDVDAIPFDWSLNAAAPAGDDASPMPTEAINTTVDEDDDETDDEGDDPDYIGQ